MYITNIDESVIGGPNDDYPNIDQRSCRLLGPTALVVQGVMGILLISSLVYKRHRETPKRPWQIWSFDVSKQVFGQGFVHGLNVLISDLGSHRSSGRNACVYYFLNILIDTTFGVAIIYFTLRFLTFILSDKLQLKGMQSGQYGSPPSISFWFRQTAVYLIALTVMKLVVIALFAVWPDIFLVGAWLLRWTKTGVGEIFEVSFVMGIFPIMMNIIQFWLIDSIVKASGSHLALPPDSHDAEDTRDREPLFGGDSDDEDDTTEGLQHAGNAASMPHAPGTPVSEDSKSTVVASDDTKPNSDGSSTPIIIPEGTNALMLHEYPPSSVGSSTSRRMSPSPAPRYRSKSSAPTPLSLPRSLSSPTSTTDLPYNLSPRPAIRSPRASTAPNSALLSSRDKQWASSPGSLGEKASLLPDRSDWNFAVAQRVDA